MAEAKGKAGASKGASASPAKKGHTGMKGQGTGGSRKPREHPEPTDAPSVKIPMSWVAVGASVGGTWYLEGQPIEWPRVGDALTKLGTSGTDNVVVVPRPTDLVDSICENFGFNKKVSGKLPDLVLYPTGEGNNQEIIAQYMADHPPFSTRLDTPADWNRKISVPKG